MLTIFTLPKPFRGHTGIIQRNAGRNWRALDATCEILLCGEEEGLDEFAAEIHARRVPDVAKNEFGTPLLGSAFALAQQRASYPLVMYINADMMFLPDLWQAIRALSQQRFLAAGRRWDIAIDRPLDFAGAGWAATLADDVRKNGVLHSPTGMDYFIFPKGSVDLPLFAVGRPGWDSWLVYKTRSRGVPVIDCTAAITAIHQNHDYSHSVFGVADAVRGPEYRRNIEIAGGMSRMMTLRDADRVLDNQGLRRPSGLRRLYSSRLFWYPLRGAYWVRRRIPQLLTGRGGAA